MSTNEINPFDILSGNIIQNEHGTFYFNKPGYNLDSDGFIKAENAHRIDGPAAIYKSGTKKWFVGGKLHRLDGPAIEWNDGVHEWYINGIRLTESNFRAKILCMKKV